MALSPHPFNPQAALDFYVKLTTPLSATFVDRSAQSSKIVAEGNCASPTFAVNLNNPNSNSTRSSVVGNCEGCTTGQFLIWGGANTQGSTTGAVSFFYAVPANRLVSATYSLTTIEELTGRVRLESLFTFNGPLVSPTERNFSASFDINRQVNVLDGAHPVLSIVDHIGSGSSGGNSNSDSFIGASVNNFFELTSFITSEFAVSGDNDLVLRFDYIFTANAQGDSNRVIFSGLDGTGSFTVRNQGVTLQGNIASMFGSP